MSETKQGIWIKLISENRTDFYTDKLKFEVGKTTVAPDWDSKSECGGGIHFSHSLYSILSNTNHNNCGYLIEVKPVSEIVELKNKVKAREIEVIRELSFKEWLETLDINDSDEWNRLMRACKTNEWNSVFNNLKK